MGRWHGVITQERSRTRALEGTPRVKGKNPALSWPPADSGDRVGFPSLAVCSVPRPLLWCHVHFKMLIVRSTYNLSKGIYSTWFFGVGLAGVLAGELVRREQKPMLVTIIVARSVSSLGDMSHGQSRAPLPSKKYRYKVAWVRDHQSHFVAAETVCLYVVVHMTPRRTAADCRDPQEGASSHYSKGSDSRPCHRGSCYSRRNMDSLYVPRLSLPVRDAGNISISYSLLWLPVYGILYT